VVYENLEDNADKIMREFVRNVKLAEKTDFRMFGFNNLRGLYAGHCIKMGDFHKWQLLEKWV